MTLMFVQECLYCFYVITITHYIIDKQFTITSFTIMYQYDMLKHRYAQTPTDLAGDEVLMSSASRIRVSKKDCGLRPGIVETSIFVLNQSTGNPICRTWSWEVFAAIENNCETAIVYGKYSDAVIVSLPPEDTIESWAKPWNIYIYYMTLTLK